MSISAPLRGFLVSLLCVAGVGAEENVPLVRVVPRAELGVAAVLQHRYQSGTGGTSFDFVNQGGNDTLFPYTRFSADVIFKARHYVTLVYQPLTFQTSTVADRNGSNGGRPVVIDDASFAPGTPIDVKYGFDFWRASYLYNFAKHPTRDIFGVGLSLQLRNASIVFTSGDGNTRVANQNIGPVPIIKLRAARWFSERFGLDVEADGFYASSAIFNGSGKPFTGWIWDAAVTAKTRFLPNVCTFLALRAIGGGARGNNAYPARSATTSVNAFTYDNLSTLALSLGATLE